MRDTARQRVPVPADTELPDKLVAGLTGRQVVITAIAVLVIWAGYMATRTVLPLPVFAVLAAPVAVAAAAVAIGQRDGLTLDRLLAAAWRQARSPRRMVTAPEGVPAVPGWVAPGLARQAGPVPAPVTPPWQLVTPDGVIGLGGDGAAAVCAVSTVNFALRSPAEQEALTAAYGRWLHSLTGPVQILIRTGHADLASAISRPRANAPSLPAPGAGTSRADPRRLPGRAGRHPAGTDPAGAAGHPRSRPGRPRPARQRGRAGRPARRRGRPVAGQRRPASPAAGRRPDHRAARSRQRPRRPAPRPAAGPARPPHPARPCRPGGAALRRAPGAGQDGLPAPPALQIAARHVEIDGDCAATLAVTGYPAEVAPGWLEPLTSYPGRLDIALHIEPVPSAGGRGPAAAAAREAGVLPPDLGRAGPAGRPGRPRPPPRTPARWPTRSPAARASCSGWACT